MAWFERWRTRRSKPPATRPADDAWPAQSAGELLDTPARRSLLVQIRQLTSVPDEHWQRLYLNLFEHYACLVQELPASAYHHHAYRGGLLDHGLEVVLNGLKLRRGQVLPAGAAPEHIGPATELYTYAIATGCLLHDSGKLVCDQIIEADGQRWFPWRGPLQQSYRMRFVPGRSHQLHQPAGLLLAPLIIPAAGLTWLATDFEVWAQWLGALSGQVPGNPLYNLIVQADRASVARDLGASPGRATQPPPALHTKLLTALRHLLDQGTLALNRKGAAGWLTDDSLWLVSKTVADALRAHLLAEGHDGIPTHNVRLFEVLQEHGLLVTHDNQAVWRCTVDDGNGWRYELTLLRLAPTTVWKPEAMPARWAGTVTPLAGETPVPQNTPEASHPPAPPPTSCTDVGWLNPALVSTAQVQPAQIDATKGPTAPASQVALGQQFLDWVRDGVQKGTLAVNDTTALVHGVAGGVFLVTPAIFKVFVRDHPAQFGAPANASELLQAVKGAGQGQQRESWFQVQKAFQLLRLHEKHPLTSENIRRCRVLGARRQTSLQGYWLPDARGLLDPGRSLGDNPYLTME